MADDDYTLTPVDYDPFVNPIPEGTTQQLGNVVKGIGQGIANALTLPGAVATGQGNVQPTVPGQWSDEDEARLQATSGTIGNRATDLAGLMVGTGSPFPDKIPGLGKTIPRHAGAEQVGTLNVGARDVAAGETAPWGYGGNWYHGTNAPEFTEFDPTKGGEASGSVHDHPAVFLTNDADLAQQYANTGVNTVRDTYPWGAYKVEAQKPMVQALKDLPEPLGRLLGTEASADAILNGGTDLKGFADYGATPSQIARISEILDKHRANEISTATGEGSRVMPVVTRGNFMPMSMLDGFNEVYWDAALKAAKEGGWDGVHFQGVVDSPTGRGDPADVLAVFDPKNIRSKFAAFNPANNNSGFLLGSGSTDKRLSGAIAGEQAANAAQPQGIRAYHGSPYDFDKFDLSKIGTGEGAQAYGKDLYFAENPATAKVYKDSLTPDFFQRPTR